MSDLIPISSNLPSPTIHNRGELLVSLAKASQAWEKINLIEHTVKKCGLDPFIEMLDIPHQGILGEDVSHHERQAYPDSLVKALALQGFGKISNLEGKSQIAALREEDAISHNLLTVLKQEAKNGETFLIRWSAAMAIKSIWYDAEYEKQGKYYHLNVGFDPEKVERSILENQVNRLLSRQNIRRYDYTGQRLSIEYEEYLDFWVYGPTWELFNLDGDSEEYQFLVNQIFEKLQGRAVWYGLSSIHYSIVEKSLNLVETFWKQFDNLALIRFLSQFLQHPYADFRDRTVYILSKHQEHLDKKSTFILKALLYDFTESSQWIKLKDRFSLLIAQPAIPTTIKTKAETLKFLFDPFEKKIFNTITIDQIDVYISATEEDQKNIESVFSNAISSCEAEATTVINLFSSEKDNHLLAVLNHLLILIDKREVISNTRSTLIEKQERLSAMWQEIKKDDIEIYNSSKTYPHTSLPETYDDCVKKYFEKYLNEVEKDIQSLQEVIQCRKKLCESRQQLARKLPEIKYKDGEFHQYILASKNYQDLMFSSLPITCEQCTKLEESLNNFKRELKTVINLREVCQHNESLIVELLKRMKRPPLKGLSNQWKLNLPNPLTYQKAFYYNQQLNSLRDQLHSTLQSDVNEISQTINGINSDLEMEKKMLPGCTILAIALIISIIGLWQIMANVVGVFLFKIVCSVIFVCSTWFIFSNIFVCYLLQPIHVHEDNECDSKKYKDQILELKRKKEQARQLQQTINQFLSQWKTWTPH